MTEPCNGNILFRGTGEGLSALPIKDRDELVARIESEHSDLPVVIRNDGDLEVDAAFKSTAEEVVDSPSVNREGQAEIYLFEDPAKSNLPPFEHARS